MDLLLCILLLKVAHPVNITDSGLLTSPPGVTLQVLLILNKELNKMSKSSGHVYSGNCKRSVRVKLAPQSKLQWSKEGVMVCVWMFPQTFLKSWRCSFWRQLNLQFIIDSLSGVWVMGVSATLTLGLVASIQYKGTKEYSLA